MVILLMRFLFKIPIQGSILELYVVGLLFIAAVLGLGMLISTIAKTQMQAMQMSTFFLLPFVFLSGYVFPIDGMPKIFQYMSRIIPARYFIEVLRGIILRGAGLADLWRPDRVAGVLHDPDHRPGGRALQEDRVVTLRTRCRRGGPCAARATIAGPRESPGRGKPRPYGTIRECRRYGSSGRSEARPPTARPSRPRSRR